MIVGTKPKRLLPNGVGRVVFMVQNQHATQKVFIHTQEENLNEAFEVNALSTTAPFPWAMTDLWITGAVNNMKVAVLVTPTEGFDSGGRGQTPAPTTVAGSFLGRGFVGS